MITVFDVMEGGRHICRSGIPLALPAARRAETRLEADTRQRPAFILPPIGPLRYRPL